MSGRIVNVRPKPGFLMDGAGDIIPTRQNVVPFLRDRLTNVMSGMGTTVDKRTAGFYAFMPMTGQEAEASYRTSWLVRKIVDIPPFDMTREWRDWQAENADIEKLEAEEKRLQLKSKCERALVLARLFGGGALILGTGDADPTQPLNPAAVKQGGLQYVHVMSRWQLSEGQPRLDPADPWFMQPDYFELRGTNQQSVKLHPSRVVAFVGQKAPEGSFYPSSSWFWGDPLMQSIGEAVRNADLAQAGFSSLIDRAAVDILKLKNLMSIVGTTDGEQKITARLAAAKMGVSNWRSLVIDAEDDWQSKQVSWSGIPDTLLAFLDMVAGAADIPLTRLLGQSPRGLQSTGDGEQRDYHAMVKARQSELLAPALDRIDELLIPSALGSRPSDVYYEFGALDDTSEAEAATIEKDFALAIQAYATTGVVPDTVLIAMVKGRSIEGGRYPGVETAWEEAEAAAADPTDPSGGDPNYDPSALTEPAPADEPPPAGTTRVKAHIRKLRTAVAALKKAGAITGDQADEFLADAKALLESR